MTTATTVIGLMPVFLTEGRGSDVIQLSTRCHRDRYDFMDWRWRCDPCFSPRGPPEGQGDP